MLKMTKRTVLLPMILTMFGLGSAHAVKPDFAGAGGGGGGGGARMSSPPTAVSNPKWQAPNPSGLARAIGGKKTPKSEIEQLKQEKRDMRKKK